MIKLIPKKVPPMRPYIIDLKRLKHELAVSYCLENYLK